MHPCLKMPCQRPIASIHDAVLRCRLRIGHTLALLACSIGLVTLPPNSALAADDIKVGHLTYHTGEYGAFGDFFDAITDFSLNVINEDPPLGRPMIAKHVDAGTVGEAQAALGLINDETVDVLLNPAHHYLDYRDSVLAAIAAGRHLLLPSVHGGAIDAIYGGTAEEPLFRGAPMDSSLGTAAVLHARDSGISSISIVSSDIRGAKMQRDAATRAAKALGIVVSDAIEFHSGAADFDEIAEQVESFVSDAVLIFAPPGESGQLVHAGAAMGASWFVIGGTELFEPSFIETATFDSIEQHASVSFTGFSFIEDQAWDYYQKAVTRSSLAERIGYAGNTYAIQYYDLLIATALAIEKAGSTDPAHWAAAMHAVTGDTGVEVHTYDEGIAALRAGNEINYEGVTGSMRYSKTGVVAGTIGLYEWESADMIKNVTVTSGDEVLILAEEH